MAPQLVLKTRVTFAGQLFDAITLRHFYIMKGIIVDPVTLHYVVLYGLSATLGIITGVAGGILRMNFFWMALIAIFLGATIPPYVARTFFPV